MKKIIKHYLKNSKILFNVVASAIFLYLKIAYFTSSWRFIMPENLDEEELDNEKGLFFAICCTKLRSVR